MADTAILSNPLKDMMKAGKVALGMNVRLARSGDIARIAKSCGHDFIFIDGQHAIFSVETRSEERRVGKECRSLCDWSSDVCSSDLERAPRALGRYRAHREVVRP